MKNISAVRCPKGRKHYTGSGKVEYPTCGHLLAGYSKGTFYIRCPICKVFWAIVPLDDNNFELHEVPTNIELKLQDTLRVIT